MTISKLITIAAIGIGLVGGNVRAAEWIWFYRCLTVQIVAGGCGSMCIGDCTIDLYQFPVQYCYYTGEFLDSCYDDSVSYTPPVLCRVYQGVCDFDTENVACACDQSDPIQLYYFFFYEGCGNPQG